MADFDIKSIKLNYKKFSNKISKNKSKDYENLLAKELAIGKFARQNGISDFNEIKICKVDTNTKDETTSYKFTLEAIKKENNITKNIKKQVKICLKN
ncbi:MULTISPECIES: hypothetical protein [Psychrilyobacter]|uniref:Uncharacterized protein n=1 Tax=Psychrilyobacter piezotolerans TaxID=2293438 RepID=A0ABX9KIB4_9FUSO|nr:MULTISPECIES: hypothetical protein [Psychrilyobacter]MCS5420293.1 hypothetical protein [Psychrilyobacter sp. S5]NDI77319.1 hypothetical protein [Psychrilyobacter piezotolerans]RDE63369.1 hypothetical protein DV867_05720 [Psychrilyobacter sp. S5]REI41911.1 hypothetical protein DYH56_05720 [Psychrilyobacter piezotolerans]